MERMKRYYLVLFLAIASWIASSLCHDSISTNAWEEPLSVIISQEQPTESDGLQGREKGCKQIHELDNQSQRPVATITESQSGYRIANSRPQRILPVNASKTIHSQGKLPLSAKYFKQKFLIFRGIERHEKSPYSVYASCLYYVIALRHIIR